MRDIHCTFCSAPLTGGLDTFGPLLAELCWPCYAEANSQPGYAYYGMGLYRYSYDEEGNIIINDIKYLPSPELVNGEYDFGYATFWPDPDTKGLGIWKPKPLAGWR